MLSDLDLEIAVKLLMATILGGILGLEREIKRKPAGLRTIMLICIGSTMFTLLSERMASRFGGDPVRIASQLIPGIGFLGVGAILREGGSVIGLTTAAIIFITASIGMAIGAGFYATAASAAILILVLLFVAGWVEDRLNSGGSAEGRN
jgi:putative Mg2+ transporter-C (MgtC) family protein